MKLRQKSVAFIVALSLSSAAMMAPKRAEAGFSLILAAWSGQPLFLFWGILGSSGSAGGAVLFAQRAWHARGSKALLYYVLAAGCSLAFVYVLDAPHHSSEAFPSLNDEKAREIGLTEAEHTAYEAERMQIQALAEEVSLQASGTLPGGRVETLQQFEAFMLALHQNWNQRAPELLSSETMKALSKMSQQLTEKLSSPLEQP
ncbi:MAG: hypothetical protein KGQ59_11100 [Bdellovibrionales bacterium]|nr:hypothetical protein [Bdellovibrionales bacterium]